MKYAFFFGFFAIGLGIFFVIQAPHDEDELMADLGPPPPWPIFIAVNVFADTLRKIADKLTPPQITMLSDIGTGYHKVALAYVIQKYKIADFVGDGTGPKTVEQIATYTKTKNVLYIERFMYACAALGMFKMQGEKTFVNTGLSAVLRRDHPNSMAGWIGHMFEDTYQPWGNLDKMFGPEGVDVVAWNIVHPDFPFNPPKSKNGIWDLFAKHPEREEQFSRAMNALEGIGGLSMAADGPFEKHSRFIDIGGSRGHFLTKVLKMYNTDKENKKTGVLFDRAPVVEIAKKVFDPELLKQKMITFQAGNFFEEKTIPSFYDGDCVILRYILHDWNDEDAKIILKNLRGAIKDKKVTLLIGESAMPNRDAIGTPPVVHWIDMQMMVIFGGASERYPKHWERLLKETGFKLVTVHPTRSILAWVEAIPI